MASKLKRMKDALKAKPVKNLGLAMGTAAVAGSLAYILLSGDKREKKPKKKRKKK